MSMLVVEQKKGEQIIKAGERINDINIVLNGSVKLKTKNDEFLLESGSVIGLMECQTGRYICEYEANEKTLLVSYAYQNIDDFKKIFEEQPQYVYAFLHASLVQGLNLLNRYEILHKDARELYLFMVKQYREYQLMCKNIGIQQEVFDKAESIKAVVIENPIRQWEIDYIEALSKQPVALMKQFYMTRQQLCIGELVRNAAVMNAAVQNMELLIDYIEEKKSIILSEDENDIIGLWFSLAKTMACLGEDLEPINKKMREMQGFFVDKNIHPSDEVFDRFKKYWEFDFVAYAKENEAKKLKLAKENESAEMDYFEYIINYVGCDDERKEELRAQMAQYREIAGTESNEREILVIRNRMTETFFDLYGKVFFKSLETDSEPSTIIQLFLRFGYLDSELLEEEQIEKLFEMNKLIEEKQCEHVYTFYDWLKLILSGEKEPSKNEFDLDYFGSLRELRKANKISVDEEKILQRDKIKKVQYELDNMFRSASKGTFGRSGAYSPVLSKYTLTIPLEKMIMSQDRIIEAINKVKLIDFRCFYREVLFFDPAHENTSRMMIQKEVLPDVILIPNCGQRGMMWQESDGVGREGSARFLLPILSVADLDNCMIDVIGKYRWEICRKLQGMRWNDVTEPSLTSEYYDFLEFYKKNRDISASIKEKVKSTLTRVKGSYREFFVLDYINWVKYESNGNFRLNKVSREILSKYCPFPSDVRYKLLENPMFRGIFSRYENMMVQQETKIKNNLSRYKHDGGEITEELMETLHFYSK